MNRPLTQSAQSIVEYLDTLTAERDRLAACVERVRECKRYEADYTFEGSYYHEAHIEGEWMRAADILAALGGTNG
jgi:hypothetical protein